MHIGKEYSLARVCHARDDEKDGKDGKDERDDGERNDNTDTRMRESTVISSVLPGASSPMARSPPRAH